MSRPTADEIEMLIERYTGNLMRAALSLGFAPADAEELVQATFFAYLQGGERFEKRSSILTYLFGILYNKARETRRFRNRHDSLEAIDETFESHFDAKRHWNEPSMQQMSEVEKRAQSSAWAELLTECLDGLSAAMRMAFTMKEVEGLASPEICRVLGLTPTHLGVTLFRARNKLRECLSAKGAVIA